MDARFQTTLKIAVTLATVILAVIVIMGIVAFVQRVPLLATVVLGAIFLAYVIYPSVRWLNLRLPLWASILITYAVVIVLVGLILAFIIPALARDVRQAVENLPALERELQTTIANPQNNILDRLPPQVREYVDQLPLQFGSTLAAYGGRVATGAVSVALSAASVLALFIAIPIVSIYLLLDLDSIGKSTLGALPLDARTRVAKIAIECNTALGGFIRGQLLVAAAIGVLVFGLLEGLRVPYASLIAVFAGIVEIVPYVGAIAGGLVAVVTAFITNGWENALFVLLGFIAINQLEGHIIYPLFLSGAVGLSPLVVILALLAGGELWGIPGLIIAIPIAALVKVLLENLIPKQEPLKWTPTLRRAKRQARVSQLARMIEKARLRRRKP